MKVMMCTAITATLLTGCNLFEQTVSNEENYYFAEGTDCAYIFYDIEDAPSLTMTNRIVDYHFDDQNLFVTSSPRHFGWRSENSSGWKKQNLFVNEVPVVNYPTFETNQFEVYSDTYTISLIRFSNESICTANSAVDLLNEQ